MGRKRRIFIDKRPRHGSGAVSCCVCEKGFHGKMGPCYKTIIFSNAGEEIFNGFRKENSCSQDVNLWYHAKCWAINIESRKTYINHGRKTNYGHYTKIVPGYDSKVERGRLPQMHKVWESNGRQMLQLPISD